MNLTAAMSEVLHLRSPARALEFEGRWQDWAALSGLARRIDAALSSAGAGPGTRIGLMARNRPPHVAALIALLGSGRTAVMLPAHLSPAIMARQVADLALPAVVGDSADWAVAELRAAAAGAGSALVEVSASDVMISGSAASPAGKTDVAVELLTSGTTGTPKRIPMTYQTLGAAIADATASARQTGGSDAAEQPPYIQIYPLGNIGGVYGLLAALVQHQPVVLLERFTVEGWLRAMRLYRPRGFVSLPPAAIRMVVEAGVPREALAGLPAIRSGSAPLDPLLQKRFEETYGIPILGNYGATEFCGVVAAWTLEDRARFGDSKLSSVGRARPGIGLRVVDAGTGALLEPGSTGTLEVLAPRISPEWIRTTDLAKLDEDGFLYIQGRTDTTINRGGFKLLPEAIAEVLKKHPAVLDAAVIAAPDERVGEVPVAVMELRPPHPPPADAELAALVRARLSGQHVPVRFITVAALPRTPSLKVDRATLSRTVLAP